MSRIPHYGRFFGRGFVVKPRVNATEVVSPDIEVVEHRTIDMTKANPDWRSLTWPQLRSLAASITDEPIRNRDDAERVVKAKYG